MKTTQKFGRAFALSAALFAGATAHAIDIEVFNTFDDGAACTLDGWFEPAVSPNPPTADAACGADSSCCLTALASGGFGPGSRQVILNESDWIGDFVAAGVSRVRLKAAASGEANVALRIGVTDGDTCFVSSDPVLLDSGSPGPGGLETITFELSEDAMTEVLGNNCGFGNNDLATVLTGVTQFRLLSAENVSWLGDNIASEFQIDDVEALGPDVVDSDGDSIGDDVDNCTLAANADQRDTDADGFGNVCDADLNNDCVVNFIDLGELRTQFFSAGPDADFNGDGVVNFVDLGSLRTQFFQPPGPGVDACVPQ
ncbi:MAG: hypothetical protein AAF610_02555 [Pseudomonadota bacterium]